MIEISNRDYFGWLRNGYSGNLDTGNDLYFDVGFGYTGIFSLS